MDTKELRDALRFAKGDKELKNMWIDNYFGDNREDEAYDRGVEDGREKCRFDVVDKMLEKKCDLALISECTGLSIEQIKAQQAK